ncbi:MAG: hypothetical protein ACTSRP_01900 [Candidatus Helarchaeota archaeon]
MKSLRAKNKGYDFHRICQFMGFYQPPRMTKYIEMGFDELLDSLPNLFIGQEEIEEDAIQVLIEEISNLVGKDATEILYSIGFYLNKVKHKRRFILLLLALRRYARLNYMQELEMLINSKLEEIGFYDYTSLKSTTRRRISIHDPINNNDMDRNQKTMQKETESE